MDGLQDFVVRAKAACYAGGGASSPASRTGSHDLCHDSGDWSYRDSYFGGTDFIGQEVVWHAAVPVWAMNYRGWILRPDLIDAGAAGAAIKTALSAMYREGRFLGGFRMDLGRDVYEDASDGTCEGFTGTERIRRDGIEAYRLDYHGGLIRP
jgi:Domain of unknown function (DUF5680)